MTNSILTLTLGVVVGQVTSWPCNLPVGPGRGLLAQRYGRYVAGSAGHRDRTPPDLARALVDRYSNPGDLIVDPFIGTGTMLVEAVHAGRDGWAWTSSRAGSAWPGPTSPALPDRARPTGPGSSRLTPPGCPPGYRRRCATRST